MYFDTALQESVKYQSLTLEKAPISTKENYRNQENPSSTTVLISSSSSLSSSSVSSSSSYPPLCRPNSTSGKAKKPNMALFEALAPKCSGHQLPCKLLTVKNVNSSNKGRHFYACSYPQEQQCKMFMWCEENPSFVAHSVQAAVDSKLQVQQHPLLKKLSSSQLFAFERYREKIEGMIIDEMKNEIRRINFRRASGLSLRTKMHGDSDVYVEKKENDDDSIDDVDDDEGGNDSLLPALKLTGRKDQIMERLLLESVRELLSTATSPELVPVAVLDPVIGNEDQHHKYVNNVSSTDLKEEEKGSIIIFSDDSNSDDEDDSDDDSIEIIGIKAEATAIPAATSSSCTPSFSLTRSRHLVISPETALRSYFGFPGFLPSQRWAIDRAISPVPCSSLLVMPTGSGKSLCYMVPAACLPGITVVVSPLIALMQDQMKKLPVQVPAACLSGSLDGKDVGRLSAAIIRGYVKIIYVSPERLCTDAFRSLIDKVRRNGNVVSLLAVDEAHCLSSWSYNFRPAFLRIRREITESLLPQSVLALTATAAPSVQRDICQVLHLNTDKDVHIVPSRRDNLSYFTHVIDHEEKRHEKILELLQSFQSSSNHSRQTGTKDSSDNSGGVRKKLDCTIVYVWRRDEASSLSSFLQGSGISAGCYHAGMTPDQRMNAQEAFFRGNTSVMIATVAFGMGVDKADVRNVIHSSMPKSLENYLQETGRAGRDGWPACCHLVLCKYDLMRHASLPFSSALSKLQIQAFMSLVFVGGGDKSNFLFANRDDLKVVLCMQSKSNELKQSCHHSCVSKVFIPISTLSSIDLTETAAETLLSILELPPFSVLSVEGKFKNTLSGKFRFYPTFIKDLKDDFGEPVLDYQTKCFRMKNLGARCLQILQLISSLANIKKRMREDALAKQHSKEFLEKLQRKRDRESRKANQGWYERESMFNFDDDDDDDDDVAGGSVDDCGDDARDDMGSNSYDPLSFSLQLSDIFIAAMRPRDEVTLGESFLFCFVLSLLFYRFGLLYCFVYFSFVFFLMNPIFFSLFSFSFIDLWILQKNGLIEYTLSDPVLAINLHSSIIIADSCANSMSRCSNMIADQVFAFSKRIESTNMRRIYDMWRIGMKIHAMDDHNQDESQTFIRSLLSHHMDTDTDTGTDTVTGTEIGTYCIDDIEIPLISKPVPNAAIKFTSLHDQNELNLDVKALHHDVLVLLKDPRISIIVNRIKDNIVGDDVNDQKAEDDGVKKKEAEFESFALYVCKILHGLSTVLLPSGEWRDTCAQWGRYSQVQFEHLHAFTMEVLNVEGMQAIRVC